jgi:hypothetical protein
LERQKQKEKEKSAWAGLDSLGVGGSTNRGLAGLGLTPKSANTNAAKSKPVSTASGLADDDDDWGLGDFGRKPSTATTQVASSQDKPNPRVASTGLANNPGDDWGFDKVGASEVKSTASKSGSGGGGLWDLDQISSITSTTSMGPRAQRDSIGSPSDDFGFGTRDGLLNDHDGGGGEEDDFMSVFNKPPQPKEPQVRTDAFLALPPLYSPTLTVLIRIPAFVSTTLTLLLSSPFLIPTAKPNATNPHHKSFCDKFTTPSYTRPSSRNGILSTKSQSGSRS